MQFQIRYYRSDMAEYRRRQPREMSDIERVETRDFGSPGADTGFFRHCDVLSLNGPWGTESSTTTPST
jgi:hypothetical protein